jgi:3-deoxy-D-manno-octulosonic-acid transferase
MIFIYGYKLVLTIASPFVLKAKQWVYGRRNIQYDGLYKKVQGKKVIWMHAASLGEYEQGRPLLDALYKRYPNYTYVVSFFSPSGYEHISKDNHYFLCTYLPLDTPANAKRFIQQLQPSLVLWIKYDYWYYMLKQLHQQQIPVYLIAAIFLPTQPFFKWYGVLHRQMLSFFTNIFVQHEQSKAALIKQLNSSTTHVNHIIVAGDTRYARAAEIAATPWQDLLIDAFCINSNVIVVGSTWSSDINIIEGFLTIPNVKCIVAPHNIGANDIEILKKHFPNHITYTALAVGQTIPVGCNVLTIDSMGMLSRLYRKGAIAYVGGGFTKAGIHNILEPAAYNIPVMFGPNYYKYYEAYVLLQGNAAITIASKEDAIKEATLLFNNTELYNSICANAKHIVTDNTQALSIIIENIINNMPLNMR